MNDLQHIQTRIAKIVADLKASPTRLREIETRSERDAAFLKEASAAMHARKPEPSRTANRPVQRRRPVEGPDE